MDILQKETLGLLLLLALHTVRRPQEATQSSQTLSQCAASARAAWSDIDINLLALYNLLFIFTNFRSTTRKKKNDRKFKTADAAGVCYNEFMVKKCLQRG